MLAFRFCVVVSAGAIAILGYGANAAARETLPQGDPPSVGAFAEPVPEEPSDSRVDSSALLDRALTSSERGVREIETEADAFFSETAFSPTDSIASQPLTTPSTPEEEPRPGSGATDSSSDRNSDPAPPSSHPRRERPIADVLQDSEETASPGVESADAPPPVAFSSALDPARPNPQSILEAFKSAIADNPNATSTELSSFPSAAESPEPPAEAALIVESPPSAAPQVFEALKKVMARFEGLERAIAIEDPIAPERPIAAIASESFDRETFVPFERILRRFQQANPLTEPASVLAAEQAIPVPSNLLNPHSPRETFKQIAAEPSTGEDPLEAILLLRASAPTPQSVIEAFTQTLQENLPEPSTTDGARAARAPFERILGSFNRITPRSTTARASSPESPNPNSQEETNPNVEPIFASSELADVPDAIAWINESEGEQPPSATPTSAETRTEPTAPLESAPQLPEVKSVLEAFASAIAQPPSTADRASTEIALPSRLLRIANFAQNVNPSQTEQTFAPTPFTPFERILDRFRTYTLQDGSQNEAIPADNPATSQVEPELVQAAPDVDLATPSPRSILDAFEQTILNPPLSNAESIPLPDIEVAPAPPASVPAPTQPEIVEEETVPVVPSTAPAPPQPAAVLGEIEPPNPLDSSANPLLFPTQPDEVAIDISQPITLQQAIELARRNNPTLEAARIQLDTAREGLREALAAEYPTLSTQFDFTRTDSAQQEINDFSSNPLIPNINNDTVTTSANAQLELNYNLLTGGRRTAQIRAAEAQVRFNQLNFESQAEQTRFEVTRAYYSLQEADSRVAIEAAAVEDARQTLRDAQLLERAGLGTRFDVLRAEVDLANSQQNLTTAESQQRTSRRELATTLGLGQDAIVTTADPIVQAGTWDLELEETIILAYKNRAELEQQLIQRDISEQQREVALSALRPQVNLFANYNILGIVDDDRDLADGYTVGARLQWTLFEGGAARARAAQEEKNIELAETRFDEQRNQIRLEVEQAFNNLQANEENIQTANVALQLARESLRLARLRFQAGVGTQTDVINAQTELTRARGNLLTAIISYNQSLAALQRAVSNLPDNRLFDLP